MAILKKLFADSTDNIYLQLFRYTFVGGVAFAADFGILYFLTENLHIYYLLSATISFIVGLLVNYLASKIWIFKKSTVKNRGLEFLIFTLIGVIGLIFNDLFIWIFTTWCAFHYLLSKIFATAIVYFWNFFARKFILFN